MKRREAKYKLQLRNHWLTARGEMRQMNDGRADLTEDLKPSEEISYRSQSRARRARR